MINLFQGRKRWRVKLQLGSLLVLLSSLSSAWTASLFFVKPIRQDCRRQNLLFMSSKEKSDEIEFESLLDMDVVVYSNRNEEAGKRMFGAIQENGKLAPLSVWTTDPAFGDSLEFLVDEEDRFSLDEKDVRIIYQVNESELSYASRQCARGVHNPHGEESEMLYYVVQKVIDEFGVDVMVKPHLEMLW
jgi:hypothetical protein